MAKMINNLGGLNSPVVKAYPIVQNLYQKLLASFKRDESTATEKPYNLEKVKHIHPYRKIHPWKSLKSFSESLVKNVIYNKDGLIAINKPYGISVVQQATSETKAYIIPSSCIANPVSYTLSEAMPFVAKALGYETLTVVKSPEKFMSGITLLAATKDVEEKVTKASHIRGLNKTYWIVTTRIPKQLSGKLHLALTKTTSPCGKVVKPTIITKWSKNSEKKDLIRVLNVEFQVLSNSTENLCSLLEVKSSTRKWHALRLFATTVLYSPVLGDNYTASRIQNIQGTFLNVSPFSKISETMPRINPNLLKLLYLNPSKQDIIPVHIHLRQVVLPNYLKKTEHLVLTAPLVPPFDWTFEQLKFKTPTSDCEDRNDNTDTSIAIASV